MLYSQVNLYPFHHPLSFHCFVLTTIVINVLTEYCNTSPEIQVLNPPLVSRNAARNIFLKCKGPASMCFNALRQNLKFYCGLRWSFLIWPVSVFDVVTLVGLKFLKSLPSCLCVFVYPLVSSSLVPLLSLFNIPKTSFLSPHHGEFDHGLLENPSFKLL